MATVNEILEVAYQEYNNLKEFLLTKVFPLRKEYEASHGNNDYDCKKGMNSFDVVLQYSLLQIAIKDGKLLKEEVEFIKKVTNNDLIIDLIISAGNEGFTWDDLLNVPVREIADFLDYAEKAVFEIAEDFIKSFTLYDCYEPNIDYVKMFNNSCCAFAYAIICVDGQDLDQEREGKCLLFAVIHAIEERKKSILDKDDNNVIGKDINIKNLPDAPSKIEAETGKSIVKNAICKKSLKDYYQMKKVSLEVTDHLVDYDNKVRALVFIQSFYENGVASGSGFVITESGLCFTCYHVVKGAKEIFVRLDDGEGNREVKPAFVQYFDENNDFAVLQILEIEHAYFLQLEDNYSSVKTGDEIAIYGFPFGTDLCDDVMELEPTLTKGYVASKNKLQGKYVYYLDARSCYGNSGGPVFSLKSNKVIGYLCGAYGPAEANLIYCRSLTEFFESVVNKGGK